MSSSTSSTERLWSIAVWIENEIEQEETLPSHWVDNEKMLVFWPPTNSQTGPAVSKWLSPAADWRCYPLKKVRVSKTSREFCKKYLQQNNACTSASDIDEAVKSGKKKANRLQRSTPVKKKKSKFQELLMETDLDSDTDEERGRPSMVSPNLSMSYTTLVPAPSVAMSYPTSYQQTYQSQPHYHSQTYPSQPCHTQSPTYQHSLTYPSQPCQTQAQSYQHSQTSWLSQPHQTQAPSYQHTQTSQSSQPHQTQATYHHTPMSHSSQPHQTQATYHHTQMSHSSQPIQTQATYQPASSQPIQTQATYQPASSQPIQTQATYQPAPALSPLPLPPTSDARSYQNFFEMDNKRFQYTILMELEAIKDNQNQMMESIRKLGCRIEPESSPFFLQPLKTMTEFEANEEKLKDPVKRSLFVSRVKKVGGKGVRDILRNAIGMVLTPNLQSQFNKKGGGLKNVDGIYIKRAIIKTRLFSALTDAVITAYPELTKDDVNSNIGEVLKRVKLDNTS